jgi:hypothetical protein
MEIVFGVLLLAAIPIAGIAAFFMVLGARHRLDALERRIALFEQRLTGAAAASVVVERAPARESPAPPPQPAPQAAPAQAAKPAETIPTSVPPMTPASAAAAAAPDRP